MLNLISSALNLFLVLYCLVMGIWALFSPSVPMPPVAMLWIAAALAFGKKS
jgi:hypothetical protein